MKDRIFESVYEIPVNRLLKAQEEVDAVFIGNEAGSEEKEQKTFRLRLIGEVDLYPMWRNEDNFPRLYELIDDSLNNTVVHHSAWSLEVKSPLIESASGINCQEDYPLEIWHKVTAGRENTRPFYTFGQVKGPLYFSIWFKKDNIILQNGNLCFAAEIYYKESAEYPEDITRKADAVYSLDLGEGSCDWQKAELRIEKEKEIDFILVHFKANGFTGNLWLEDPYLGEQPEFNLLPAFAPANPFVAGFNWLGLNFSKKEWPEFEVSLNGRKVFRGKLFQKIYRMPAAEIELPKVLIEPGENRLIVRYISDYREVLPYRLKRLEILKTSFGALNIISCPEIVHEGEVFPILLFTESDNATVSFSCGNENIIPIETLHAFEQAGLHTARFKAIKAGSGAEIRLTAVSRQTGCNEAGDTEGSDNEQGCSTCCTAVIERVVRRQEDGVLTGTGDAVYIGQNMPEMVYFLSWYLHHNIGNALVFRPVYRWGGSRTLNSEMWKHITRVCSEMGIYYSNMIDGRELPGCNANPAAGELQGNYYMGSQAHEKDGNYYYWGKREINPNEELYIDIWRRLADPAGLFPTTQYYKRRGGSFRFLDPYEARDMKEGAENFVRRLEQNSCHAPRHTGPSVLFRYFYQAGFKWLGAELMYGPHEVILAALRGSSLSYGTSNYGSHIAVQWSSTPHDSLQKYRRYFLSLFTCYMQGVSHINTEEGLWRLEEGYAEYERFDNPCIKLREIHQKFYRYSRTHTRRGKIHTPVAFVQGRYDGWSCFGRKNVWMQEGEEWEFSEPEKSWDLLKVFYPLSEIDSIYKHPCPNEPVGFFTGTPYGSTDIVPAEAESGSLSRYKCLIFMGWNSAGDDQAERLLSFVENGGTLILGLPHLYTETKRSEAFGENPRILKTEKLVKLLGIEIDGFQTAVLEDGTQAKAGKVELNGAEVLVKDGNGVPLVLENNVGKGKSIFLNIKAYPSDSRAVNLFEKLLHQAGRETIEAEKEKGWLKGSDTVSFTAYDIQDTSGIKRLIYFINVNWWDEQDTEADAALLWGNGEIPLKVGRNTLHTIALSDNWAVWTQDLETEVLEITEKTDEVKITLQGAGETDIALINRKTGMRNIKTHINGVKTISFSYKE